MRRPSTTRPWCNRSPVTDCSAGALYWAYDDTVTTGEVFVPEPWMTQYISSMYYPNRAETGAVMRMRLDPLDLTLESTHYASKSAFYICSVNCLFERVVDVYEI